MTTGTSILTPDGRDWARSTLLLPLLEDLVSKGVLRIPSRFRSQEAGIDALARLFDEQMMLIEKGRNQTIGELAEITDLPGSQIEALLAGVGDWDAVVHGLRLRPSNRGSIGLEDSVFVLTTSHWNATGPGVFAACSRAYQPLVKEVLQKYGHDTGSNRPHDRAPDSALLLVECNPLFTEVLGVAALPEGTQWDHEDERYAPEVRDEVRAALETTAGADYVVSTPKIVREAVVDPFVSNLTKSGQKASGLPIESGSIFYGNGLNRCLGGELDMILHLQRSGFSTFLDIPHVLIPGGVKGPQLECFFEFPGARDLLSGFLLNWAARVAFGGPPLPSPHRPVFRRVDAGLLAMAGADPEAVGYAVAKARVGKKEAIRRLRVGMLVRNEAGMLRAWGVPRLDCDDDHQVRTAIERAERNVAILHPRTGEVERVIERLQNAGLQRTGAKKFENRQRREKFLLAAAMLRTRILLGV
jgi:hypothetical protein